MTLQMALLEERMEGELQGEERKAESIAIKMLRRGRPFDEIHEDTGLSLQRIEELAKSNLDD